MLRHFLNALLALAAAFILAWLADDLLWRHRLAQGAGTGTVTVSRIVVAPLKGGREEYYPDGTYESQCTRSLFPHTPEGPCWWVQRHRTVYDR